MHIKRDPVVLTAAFASQLEAVAAPLARPRSCTNRNTGWSLNAERWGDAMPHNNQELLLMLQTLVPLLCTLHALQLQRQQIETTDHSPDHQQ